MLLCNKLTPLAFVVVILSIISLAGAFSVERCDTNQRIHMTELRISSCPDMSGDACHMKLNDRISFEVGFNTSRTYDGDSYYITLDNQHRDYKWHRAFTHQACEHRGLRCPIESRRDHSFHDQFVLRRDTISSTFRISLIDSNHNALFCLQIPVYVEGTE